MSLIESTSYYQVGKSNLFSIFEDSSTRSMRSKDGPTPVECKTLDELQAHYSYIKQCSYTYRPSHKRATLASQL